MRSPSLNAGLSVLMQRREQENEFVADWLLDGYIFWVVSDESRRSPIFALAVACSFQSDPKQASSRPEQRTVSSSVAQWRDPCIRLCSCPCIRYGKASEVAESRCFVLRWERREWC